MSTLTFTGQLVVVTCWCGLRHAIPSEMREHQMREHDAGRAFNVYCPLGHAYIPAGKTRLQREQEARERAEATERHLRDQLDAAERSKAAYKGQATRLRNRAKAGVCPCCTRTFQNVARHMASQHPDFGGEA